MSGSSLSSFSVTWTAAAALLSVLLCTSVVRPGMAQSTFNCSVVCFSNYYASISPDCDLINYVLRCYNDHLSDCESLGTASITQVENNHDTMDCPPWDAPTEVAATTEPTPTAPPLSCPAVPLLFSHVPPTLAAADVLPVMMNPDCVEYNPQQLQHCSIFGYSTLRPFQNYRTGFEACHIPGSWFLLRHRTVSVEVEGVANGENSDHTKLSKVNVTFYRSGSCLGETKSYIAAFDSPLPQNFSDFTLPDNCSANLQLQVDQEGTLATLMAPWINTTVVIRRLPGADMLAVTVQVPGRLGFESDGLCLGCPAHSRLGIPEFNDQMSRSGMCTQHNNKIVTNCFFQFAINDVPQFYFVNNGSYTDMCRYSLWRHDSETTDFLDFITAVGDDAKQLSNHGDVPRRTFEIIQVENPVVEDSLCNPQSETTTEPAELYTTARQPTTAERTETTPETTAGEVDSISSSMGNHQRKCTMPMLFALSVLSAFGVRLLLR